MVELDQSRLVGCIERVNVFSSYILFMTNAWDVGDGNVIHIPLLFLVNFSTVVFVFSCRFLSLVSNQTQNQYAETSRTSCRNH